MEDRGTPGRRRAAHLVSTARVAACLAVCLASTAGVAAANEPAAAAHEPPAAAAAHADPLDVVRERLTQKLGATQPPGASGRAVQVVAKNSGVVTYVPSDAHRATRGMAERKSARSTPEAVLAAAHAEPAAHWDYAGAGGPEAWGRMKPEFSACSTGTRQSPIDIRDGIRVVLDAVRFAYRPGRFGVLDNGHTVQVNVPPGNSIEVGGKRYELVQFHFHRPAEERIDGRSFRMVVHLVHKSSEGRLAVIAVLLETGAPHPLIQTVWNNLPLEKGDEAEGSGQLDPSALLPEERRYYTYMGSLTTPPCSEGVLWMVMQQPVGLSVDQEAVFAHLYPMNARPVQSASGRLIKSSN